MNDIVIKPVSVSVVRFTDHIQHLTLNNRPQEANLPSMLAITCPELSPCHGLLRPFAWESAPAPNASGIDSLD